MVDEDRAERVLLEILERDPRYAREAYDFVRSAVHFASHVVYERGTHVTGRELLEGIRRLAIERYGVMIRDVFAEWGVSCTEDFGEIVFNLVDAGLLTKTAEDSKDDFRNVYSFAEVFDAADCLESALGSAL